MNITGKALQRRTFLRGVGTAVALPFLDAMVPALARGAAVAKPPVRMAFLYVPCGIIMSDWNPTAAGKLTELPRILKPMEPFRDDILLLSNLTHNGGRGLLDGGGDHARATGGYLTGVQPRKTTTDIKSGISTDQVVAHAIGSQTRFPSLELGMEAPQQAGNCDSGYSCAYTNNMSWKNDKQPLPPVIDPRALFGRLFGEDAEMTPQARALRADLRQSVLDFVSDDAKKLESTVGPSDRRKLDEYFTSIREVETRIGKVEKENRQIDPHMERPEGIPATFNEHFKMMSDMLTIAFQADLTRVSTFLLGREGSGRAYREIGVTDAHHGLTHHRNDPAMIEKVAQINTFHVRQFAAWVEKLKSIKEGDSSLLDNMMVVYGSGISDGNKHTHEDLPTMIVGHGGDNFIKTGRRVIYKRETPICNLYMTMMERMGVHTETFGDGTGALPGLDVA
jgi:hypothetical protein